MTLQEEPRNLDVVQQEDLVIKLSLRIDFWTIWMHIESLSIELFDKWRKDDKKGQFAVIKFLSDFRSSQLASIVKENRQGFN
jgi:hypothetical protein